MVSAPCDTSQEAEDGTKASTADFAPEVGGKQQPTINTIA